MTMPAVPGAPSSWQQAVIERVLPQTERVRSYFLQAALPRHVAGQHVDIRLTAPDGYQAQRSYSLASAPGSDTVELAIERLDDGEVSPYFHEVARAGDVIEIRGPIGGHFVWRGGDGGPLLLVGGGSGIVPLVAMARERAATAPGTPALLVYSARTWEEIVFRDELLRAHRQDPAFDVVITTTRGPRRRDGDHERRLDRALLHDVLARWGHVPRHAFVCGANGFVETVTRELVREGLAPALVRAERYGGSG